MFQNWTRLTFLHWAYQPAVIRSLVPSALELDTLDGSAWIGLTPFLLTGLRPPVVPALPWISQFAEMNVRTYVRGPDGEPGIFFFTLEAARLAAVVGARLTYRLPYRWASMSVRSEESRIEYRSQRRLGHGRAQIVIEHGPAIRADDRAVFLTARYRLYTAPGGRLLYADVDHPPWPLQQARVLHLEQDVIENSGVPAPSGRPLAHFSPGVSVKVGMIRASA